MATTPKLKLKLRLKFNKAAFEKNWRNGGMEYFRQGDWIPGAPGFGWYKKNRHAVENYLLTLSPEELEQLFFKLAAADKLIIDSPEDWGLAFVFQDVNPDDILEFK